MELQHSGSAHGEQTLTEVLWSATTAREIVADITRDIELGRVSPARGLDLIDRVRQRAAAEPVVRPPATPLRGIATVHARGPSRVRKALDGSNTRDRSGAGDSMRA